jgi:His-Xaa-Ser system protein HxsD
MLIDRALGPFWGDTTMKQISLKIDQESKNVYRYDVDKTFYSKDALIKTIYNFSDGYSFTVTEDNKTFKITLTSKIDNNSDFNSFMRTFFDELNDQQLREILIQQTSKIRDTIIEAAFKSALPNTTMVDNNELMKMRG